jgi:hypothetical protein
VQRERRGKGRRRGGRSGRWGRGQRAWGEGPSCLSLSDSSTRSCWGSIALAAKPAAAVATIDGGDNDDDDINSDIDDGDQHAGGLGAIGHVIKSNMGRSKGL